jgi:hypothetical protein
MSRPTASVPSRIGGALPPSCQNGGTSTASRYWAFGACGAISGASIATTTRKTKTTRPMTAPRFSEK